LWWKGETDWKVIAIDVTDPLADKMSDINDVDKMMPGFLNVSKYLFKNISLIAMYYQATVEWFKIYKIPDGKPANQFAFNAEPKNKEFAENIIAGKKTDDEMHSFWYNFPETNENWKKLMSGKTAGNGIMLTNTMLDNGETVDTRIAERIIGKVFL
jgi:inorganic pyrophosphatase